MLNFTPPFLWDRGPPIITLMTLSLVLKTHAGLDAPLSSLCRVPLTTHIEFDVNIRVYVFGIGIP